MALALRPCAPRAGRVQLVVYAAKFRPTSKIGKKLIEIPKTVKVTMKDNHLTVKGPKGELQRQFHPLVTMTQEDDKIKFVRNEDTKEASAMHGMSRAMAANMVTGVSTGFSKTLELRGVGYRAQVTGKELSLSLGYSHPVVMPIKEGLTVTVDKTTFVTVQSIDKEQLGDYCADVRSKRPPEPYKGKGIRYLDEVVKQKAGKSGKK